MNEGFVRENGRRWEGGVGSGVNGLKGRLDDVREWRKSELVVVG